MAYSDIETEVKKNKDKLNKLIERGFDQYSRQSFSKEENNMSLLLNATIHNSAKDIEIQESFKFESEENRINFLHKFFYKVLSEYEYKYNERADKYKHEGYTEYTISGPKPNGAGGLTTNLSFYGNGLETLQTSFSLTTKEAVDKFEQTLIKKGFTRHQHKAAHKQTDYSGDLDGFRRLYDKYRFSTNIEKAAPGKDGKIKVNTAFYGEKGNYTHSFFFVDKAAIEAFKEMLKDKGFTENTKNTKKNRVYFQNVIIQQQKEPSLSSRNR